MPGKGINRVYPTELENRRRRLSLPPTSPACCTEHPQTPAPSSAHTHIQPRPEGSDVTAKTPGQTAQLSQRLAYLREPSVAAFPLRQLTGSFQPLTFIQGPQEQESFITILSTHKRPSLERVSLGPHSSAAHWVGELNGEQSHPALPAFSSWSLLLKGCEVSGERV